MIKRVNFHQPIQVRSCGGLMQTFEIRTARALLTASSASHDSLARLYNSVIDPRFEAGLMISPCQIKSRLDHDGEALLVGLLDGRPSAFINLVKLKLATAGNLPRTHQELTSNETFSTTRPTDGNYWFCPWVGVEPKVQARGLRAKFDLGFDKRLVSLGQLMVLAVKSRALAGKQAEKLFAYSRPARLREMFEKERAEIFKDLYRQYPLVFEIAGGELKIHDEIFRYFVNSEGVFRVDSMIGNDLLIRIADLWREKDGKKLDPVFQFHASLGARFRPDLVFAHGQVNDLNSFGYRTLLEYSLAG